MMTVFHDHFSGKAQGYAAYRPIYPEALFAWLADQCREHECAWDCATGNGQAALSLARHFDVVHATDASEQQIANAIPHDRVRYASANAVSVPFADNSIDLTTAAQAVHWFDSDAFYTEVRRVSKPGAVLAVWCYGLGQVCHEVDRLIGHYYEDIVGPFWPPERGYIEEGYRTITFPFDDIEAPAFDMIAEWSVEQMLGYLNTWSATTGYQQEHGVNPTEEIKAELRSAWEDGLRLVRWPLSVRVGRIGGDPK